ncbi:response regulator [Anaerostipes caccae]|uniref:response regulator transcription factor n=1 Tax=Anaerostipes caccae TaxID=105841 RepID=UPI002E8E1DF6|nr:response regulator [Anaerostipes caccae]
MEHYHERILIVEDDPQIRNFIGYALRQEGFGCITANSGESALNALVSEPVDMMLLDLGLPRMDGMDVLKKCQGVVRDAGHHRIGEGPGQRKGCGTGCRG